MQPVLNMRGITKRFPGVLALDHVDFDLRKGEIHALVGENGAGKSTLMKVLGGVYRPEEGEIEIGGRQVTITCPHDSLQNKVGVIYQEFNLVKTLDIKHFPRPGTDHRGHASQPRRDAAAGAGSHGAPWRAGL